MVEGVREQHLDAVLRVLGRRTGLTFPAERRRDLSEAVQRAMSRAGAGSVGEYLRKLGGSGPEFHALVTELTVGETYFFREPRQLEFIRREALPAILRDRPGGTLRVWSAGCAAGEEAYSLAILLDQEGLGQRSSVLGTDLSRDRLVRAREGFYTEWSFRGVPEGVRRRYFRARGNGFELNPGLRSRVEFRPLNLAEGDFPSAGTGIGGMDLILCRNVLIYLDSETVARVAARLLDSLSAHGWLFLGASDPPLASLVPCEVVLTDAGVAYRRAGARAAVAAPARAASAAGARAAPDAVDPPERPEVTGEPPRGRERRARKRAADPPAAAPTTTAEAAAARIRSLADGGLLQEAGRACAEALETHRTSAELLYLHALLLVEAGRHADAARAARRALYLDRTLVVAHLVLGTTLAQQGDTAGARRAFRNAERLLDAEPPGAQLRAAGGETAARLREIVRAHRALLEEKGA